MSEEREVVIENETGLEAAVIGMAGRFPGAGTINEFWDNFKNGVESITFFNNEELEAAGVDPGLAENPKYVKAGVILADIEYFDTYFFGYPPREAEVMDPQVRLFHECAWHALEHAGCDPDSYNGLIGLYAGASSNFPWQAAALLSGSGSTVDPFSAYQLKDKDFMCVHVSYRLNLKGPSLLVSSACSTSLAAVVLACQGLLSGECDMALAGGATVHIPQGGGYMYEEGKISSPDGHCRAFDAKSAGTIPGSGVGVVVLKLLENAREDGDNIYALVKGSGINNDGVRKAGFTAPSVDGQAEVIRAALRMADVPAESITYVETHGTGTTLGDPVEIEALKLAFESDKKNFCALGSLKSSMGHLDSAAGVAGFIKTVLALKHKHIPPSLHFQSPNPKIDFKNSPFYVNTTLKEWRREQYPLRAGVSAFGIGGTNVHVVLEEWPMDGGSVGRYVGESVGREYQLMLLSAKTGPALERMSANLANHLKANPGIDPADVAYTLQVGRKSFEHRQILVCSTVDEAVQALSSPSPGVHRQHLQETGEKKVVFMFPGQGSQYVNMGLDLYDNEPLFREEINRCFEILEPIMDYNIKEILYPSNTSYMSDRSYMSHIDNTEIAQPVLFVFEYALAKLLMSWGIAPYAMTGHSIGEYTAACLAGVFSLEDALSIVVRRGKLMRQMPAGAMLSVALGEESLTPLLPDNLSLAAVNSPGLCTVSGPMPALEAFEKQMKEKGCQCRFLHTSHAFHSPMMDPIVKPFEAAMGEISLRPPGIPYLSNVTGDWITIDQAIDPGYWAGHLRRTVRFADGVALLLQEKNILFLEVGPGMVLSTLVAKHPARLPEQKTVNLVRHPNEKETDDRFLLEKTGRLWLYGVTVDWKRFHASGKRRRTVLPGYPFERQRFPVPGQGLRSLVQSRMQLPLNKRPDPADWCYQPSWKRVRSTKSESDIRLCLLFAREEGPASAWGKLLEQQGLEVIEVNEGATFAEKNSHHFTLAPGEPEHYRQLFQRLKEEKKTPHCILHSWNITGAEQDGSGELGEIDIGGVLDRSFYSLVYLAQSIGRTNPGDAIRLTVLSDLMQDVVGEPVHCPWKSVLLGPVQTIPKEYPHLDCRAVDISVPPAGSEEEKALVCRLVEEMAADNSGRVIAYRSGNSGQWVRWVQHVEPLRLEKPVGTPPRLREGGVYLVTGGAGGIGLTLAGYLAVQVKAKLVLTGRSAGPPGDKLQALESMGAEVLYFSADAADRQRMGAVVTAAEQRFGPINGIIHSAGIADAGMIQRRTKKMSEDVFAPKIKGTLILDAIFKNHPLDFLILCSSLASLWAPPGQTAYTAANCFLDSYAHNINQKLLRGVQGGGFLEKSPPGRRRQICTSIDWDTWQQVGMAEAMNIDLDTSAGILPSEGQDIFERILSQSVPIPQVPVCTRDLALLTRRQEDEDIFPDQLREKVPESAAVYSRPELASEYVEPGTGHEKMLAGLLRDLLGMDRVGIFDNFFELGISSLDVINIANQLKKMPGMDISAVIIFENPTIQLLARYLDIQEGIQTDETVKEKKDRSAEIDTGKNRLGRMLRKTKAKEVPDE